MMLRHKKLATAATVALTLSLVCRPGSTAASERIALIVGNDTYTHLPKLSSPVNDAKAVYAVLTSAGFEAALVINAPLAEFRRSIDELAAKIGQVGTSPVVVVYYAGQGLQRGTEQFLLPVDVDISDPSDLPNQAISLSDLLNATGASRSRVFILDASLDSPFSSLTTQHGVTMSEAPLGSFIAYSTAPGARAELTKGANSGYSRALVEILKEPGLQIDDIFKRVRQRVVRESGGSQIPWESSALRDNLSFSPPR